MESIVFTSARICHESGETERLASVAAVVVEFTLARVRATADIRFASMNIEERKCSNPLSPHAYHPSQTQANRSSFYNSMQCRSTIAAVTHGLTKISLHPLFYRLRSEIKNILYEFFLTNILLTYSTEKIYN